MSLAVIVLAAGEGTRMKSSLPKVLHQVCGMPMIHHVVRTARQLEPDRVIVIVGHKADVVREALEGVETVVQDEQLGTGHAVSVVEPMLAGFDGTVIVLSGDTPLLRAETLEDLRASHERRGAAASILTARLKDPTGYGRIIEGDDRAVTGIVEEKDATAEQRAIDVVNSGTYCFAAAKLFPALARVGSDNKQGEHYLTDVIEILSRQGETIVASLAGDATETMGVNNRVQLAEADKVMRGRINRELMVSGVTIVDPDSTFVSADATIGRDTVIHPMSFISGATTIGEGCEIGPMSRIIDSKIGDGVVIEQSIVRRSRVADGAVIGPFTHLRPDTTIGKGAKVGAYAEVKKSDIGEGSKVPHLSYVGDARIGDYVNIGAGTITCNYDGLNKYTTVIEDEAFIGSDTMLVAPVKIGKGAFTAAGSVITRDVPDGSLAVERTQQAVIENWAAKRRKKKDITES